MQYTFYFDQSRCIGCHTCVAACNDWNEKRTGEPSFRTLVTYESGSIKTGNITVKHAVFSCNHCAKPACADACPSKAIIKREYDGVVIIDESKCTGAKLCVSKCPFNAPKFNDNTKKARKCTMCWDRLENGQIPVCVGSCPLRAIDFGTVPMLKSKYPDAVKSITGFPVSETEPSIFFKAKL